ncbi:gas vesicle protein [Egicoccus halophilus]|uniref:Gas vesicle protein n=1 Tax=Egicoccus halophilus TaxID=1670830 RepID=A0A8J3ABV3_9ACTN|nr:gas vesicle protein [Egicoccus halophilus]GGI07910.1 hypothetical protein GCM10011354_26440 [Egicoccus halophilus]
MGRERPASQGRQSATFRGECVVVNAAVQPHRDREGSLVHVIETLLDKGLVLNADIMVSVAGVELLGVKIRAALASFDTAARYGLEFPSGTNTSTLAWQETLIAKEACPDCGKRVPTEELLRESCPWCGWQSARALAQGQASTPELDEGGDRDAERTTSDDRGAPRESAAGAEQDG